MSTLRCPYCYKLVKKAGGGSKQFIHADHKDYFKCLKIPTYAIEKSKGEMQ